MQTGQVIHTEIHKQNVGKHDDGPEGDAFAFPSTAPDRPLMGHGGVGEPRDEEPGLFRIPAPVITPKSIKVSPAMEWHVNRVLIPRGRAGVAQGSPNTECCAGEGKNVNIIVFLKR